MPGRVERVVEDRDHAPASSWIDRVPAIRADACIHQLIEEQARSSPEATAITCIGQSVSYAELDARADRLAARLRQLGVGPDTLVALFVDRSIDMVVGLIGILKAGGAYVPLDPNYPADRLAMMLEDAATPVLVTQRQLAPHAPPFAGVVLTIDDDHPSVAGGADAGPPAEPHHLAYVVYTSGSTGRPKGVMVEHRNVVNFFAGMDGHLDAPGVWLAVTSISFDISVLELFWALARGFHIVLAAGQEVGGARAARLVEATGDATPSPDRSLADLFAEHPITHFQCTPSMARLLLAQPEACEGLRRLRHMLVGGEAFPPALASQLHALVGGIVRNVYGPTETTVWSATHRLDGRAGAVPLGHALANQDIVVIDEAGVPVPPGVEGELVIGGRGVVRGYLHRPELTAERFVAHPTRPGERAYRTGDLGRCSAAGLIEFLGRLDHQVKIRGHRIELGEVEAALAALPGVQETVVAADRDHLGDTRLVAYYVPRTGHSHSAQSLREALRRTLPDVMVPALYMALPAMPQTPNGKIDRKALPAPRFDADPDRPATAALADDLQERLAAIWREVLDRPVIGPTDDFFDLGGHSLLAAQLHRRIRAEVAQHVTLTDIFRHPTVQALAARLAAGPQAGSTRGGADEASPAPSGVILIRPGGPRPPLFFIHDGFGETLLYRTLALLLSPERAIYGVPPHVSATGGFGHTTVVDMAMAYVADVRAIQPHGPYLLAGLCGGGVIAFEMAKQLQAVGERVAFLGLIEAADVDAVLQPFYTVRRRLVRLRNNLPSSAGRGALLASIAGKARNALAYEIADRRMRARHRRVLERMRTGEEGDTGGAASGVSMRFMDMYQEARDQYRPGKELLDAGAVLFQASEGSGEEDDIPFIEQYRDILFGWGKRLEEEVSVVAVPGGHSTLLRPPHVAALAEAMQAAIERALDTSGPAGAVATGDAAGAVTTARLVVNA